jgi:Ni/Co efflux regulator RcnB
MNMRIKKKILANPNHPRHASTARFVRWVTATYGRAECRRKGLDPEKWNSYTLRWPPRIMYWLQFTRGLK